MEREMPDLQMRVLVVDDFPTMRRIVKTLLRQLGYTNVIEAEDGQAGLAKLRNEKIDLVLLDWNMPKMTGLELLKAIRADDALHHIPVVMITAEGRKEDVLEAVKAGVNNFVVKPFTAETLEEKLAKVIEKKSA
jgi:two-component system chemotaxis response regulator CheY